MMYVRMQKAPLEMYINLSFYQVTTFKNCSDLDAQEGNFLKLKLKAAFAS